MRSAKAFFLAMFLFSSAVSAAESLRTKIFKVGEITVPPVRRRLEFRHLGKPILIQGLGLRGDVEAEALGEDWTLPFGPDETDPEPFSTFISSSSLISLIRDLTGEGIWKLRGARLELEGDKLLVTAASPVLERIEEILNRLRERRRSRVQIEFAIVPPEALETATAGRMEVGAVLPRAVFDKVLALAGEEAAYRRSQAQAGEVTIFEPSETHAALMDYEVFSSGAEPIGNAVVESVRTGLMAAFRPALTPRHDSYRLDYIIGYQNIELGRRRHMWFGDLDLPDLGGVALRGTVLAPEGKTVVLGELAGSDPACRRFSVLTRVRALFARPPGDGTGEFAFLEIGSFLRPWPRPAGVVPTGDPFENEESETFFRLFSEEDLEAELRRSLPREVARNSDLTLSIYDSLLAVSAPSNGKAVREATPHLRSRIESLFEENVRTVSFRLWCCSVARDRLLELGEEISGGTVLPPDWRRRTGANVEAEVRLNGLCGIPLRLWSGRGRRYVADVEVVSGGREDLIVQEYDPVIKWAGTGMEVELSVRPVPGARSVQVWLRVSQAKSLSWRETRVKRLGRPTRSERAAEKAPREFTVDLPAQEGRSFRRVITFPAGKPCLVDQTLLKGDPARVSILVAQARLE